MAYAYIRICDTCGAGSPPSVAVPAGWIETGSGPTATHLCVGCNGGDALAATERAARLAQITDDEARKLGFSDAAAAKAPKTETP